jgi:hypothetical protein
VHGAFLLVDYVFYQLLPFLAVDWALSKRRLYANRIKKMRFAAVHESAFGT